MLEMLLELLRHLLSTLQQCNTIILTYLSGILSMIAACAAMAAYRKFARIEENQNAMQRLADAIIKQHNRELRDSK